MSTVRGVGAIWLIAQMRESRPGECVCHLAAEAAAPDEADLDAVLRADEDLSLQIPLAYVPLAPTS